MVPGRWPLGEARFDLCSDFRLVGSFRAQSDLKPMFGGREVFALPSLIRDRSYMRHSHSVLGDSRSHRLGR